MYRSSIVLRGHGAVHPNGSNFRRFPRYDIVHRMRHLVKTGMYSRPSWLTLVENVPPPELHSMRVQTQSVKNPYPSLVRYILKRYPDLRFQDLYVEGNDWSQGNDTYRDDHPVMQFAARQLQLMNQGYSRRQAFDEVETWFNDRRKMLELQQKLDMASTVQLSYGLNGNLGQGKIRPLFNTGQAYLLNQVADRQMRILQELNIHLKSKIAAVGSKQMDAGTFSSADIDKVKEVSFDPTSRILAAMTNQPGKRTSQSLQETTRKSQRHASSALRAALKLLAVEKKSTVGGEASPITLQDLEKISSVLEEIDESTSAADIILSSEFQQKNRKQSEITEAEASKEQLPTSTNSTSSTSINGTAIEKPVVKSKKLSREEKLAQIEAELLKVLQSDEYDDEDDVAESQKSTSTPTDRAPRASQATMSPTEHWTQTPTSVWNQKSTQSPPSASVASPQFKLRRNRQTEVHDVPVSPASPNRTSLRPRSVFKPGNFKDDDDKDGVVGGRGPARR